MCFRLCNKEREVAPHGILSSEDRGMKTKLEEEAGWGEVSTKTLRRLRLYSM